ncbi:exostosin [Paramecium bursaria Chlorella virus MA1D]|nr:exostosin [Paramecium bursaria Chlorella virus MA1D]
MKLSELTLESDDFITSDKLYDFCKSMKFGATYVKTDFIKFRTYQYIVSNSGWRNDNNIVFFEIIPILVTGHSDYDISERELDIIRLPNLRAWFCQNRNIQHPKVIAFPLGITNKDEPNSEIHRIIGNTDRILEVSKTPKDIKNLVYLNITVKNFPEERQRIVDLYNDKPWVSVGKCEITDEGHRKFLEDICTQVLLCASWKWNRHSSSMGIAVSQNDSDREKTYCNGTIYRSTNSLRG